MNIQSEIERLFFLYDSQISDCDLLLEPLKLQRKEARRLNNFEVLESLRFRISVLQAQKQAYVQFLADLDSLRDCL